MNKLLKFLISVMGACSIVFEILTPIVITLWLFSLQENILYVNILILAAILASLYRGLKHLLRVGDLPKKEVITNA